MAAGNLAGVQALAATTNCLSQLASIQINHPVEKLRELFNKAMLTRQAVARQSKTGFKSNNLLHLHLLALRASVRALLRP